MLKPHVTQRFVLTVPVVALTVALAGVAWADTIYMKNGRVIQSSAVRVEGDRVIFFQYGGEVSVPMALVDRIVEDANAEPAATPVPAVAPTDPNDPEAGATPEPGTGTEGDVPPEETREYWREQVATIAAEREQVELQIEDLKRTERAFLFSHRSTAETRTQIEAAEARLVELDTELRDLQTEARRRQVPAGWLRLPPSGGGTGG